MTSGRKKPNFHVRVKDYENAHSDPQCKGKWQPVFIINGCYSDSVLGPIKVPCLPLVGCRKCETSYLVPGFGDWIEDLAAEQLVRSKGILTKNQIKFLRLHVGLTQEEMAKKLQIADKHELSKMESSNFPDRTLSKPKQFMLKVICAKLLKLEDIRTLDAIYEAAEGVDSTAQLDLSEVSAKDVEHLIRKNWKTAV